MRTSTQEMFFLKKSCFLEELAHWQYFLKKKLNIHSEEVAQGQQIWPLQHPPTAAMEVTVDWKIHVQAARLHVRHLVVAHSRTILWLVEGKLLVLLLKMHQLQLVFKLLLLKMLLLLLLLLELVKVVPFQFL